MCWIVMGAFWLFMVALGIWMFVQAPIEDDDYDA